MSQHSDDGFADRQDAGRQLASALQERDADADVVLAVPRGGLPLGREVADALGLPLSVAVAQKMGSPGNPEYAIGAVASDGTTWLDEAAIERAGVDDAYVEQERQETEAAAREKADRYPDGDEALDLQGQRVVIVDDGAATGATAIAATQLARESGASDVLLAVPVAPPGTLEELTGEADTVVCLLAPPAFQAVGQYYEQFGQVTDEEAIQLLEGNG